MKEITFPLKELFIRPKDAFARLKATPPLAAMLILYIATVIIGYSFSAQFYSFDSLKAISPYLEKLNLHISHPMLFILSSSLAFTSFVLGTWITHGVTRVMGGTGTFKVLFTCLLFIGWVGMALKYLLFVASFARLIYPPLYYIRHLMAVVWLWELGMGAIAVIVVYGLSIGKSIFAYLTARFFQFTLIAVLMAGVSMGYFVKTMPNTLAERLSAPHLELVQIPADASEWTVRSMDGKDFKLGNAKGKVVFLNFWATWCMPCVAEMPSIHAAYKILEGKQVMFVCVSNEGEDKIQKFQEKHQSPFQLFSMKGPSPTVFASNSIPVTFILSPDQKTALKYVGAAKWDSPETIQAILTLLKN